MVGAGALVQPLLGLPHWLGVVLVGTVVILIVVTAGMVSTTWVQFIKGSLLVVFSAVLTMMILARGLKASPEIPAAQTIVKQADGTTLINGLPKGDGEGRGSIQPVGSISKLPGGVDSTGPVGPLEFFSTLEKSEIILWKKQESKSSDGSATVAYEPSRSPGSNILQPGASPTFAGLRSGKLFDKLNFLSLMLALFCGTASLPHILIRYYTVKDEAAARKSTIVGIACIGFFYILTLYMGLGAMTSGALDPTDSNMAAPLLARSISELLFAIISAIAFTTVLGTVSGLILASAGAVTHDLLESAGSVHLTDHQRVRIAKMASVAVGVVAIVLGILFKELNVSYLVGWAFSVAASANLPALVMLLFWRGTTRQGIIAAVLVGMASSLAWILLSGDTFASVYGLPKENSPVPFSQPGIVTIPLGFATLVLVSLFTQPRRANASA
jgi:cation/acetate symporter